MNAEHHQHREAAGPPDTGAGTGLIAAVLFAIALIAFLTTSPTGDPRFPNIGSARFAPAYFTQNLSTIRLVTLLTIVGTALFLWFLASLWARFTEAEAGPARGPVIVLIGGIAGAVLVLLAQGLTATAALANSPGQASTVPTLYVASALLTAFGGGLFAVFFFFGVAKTIFQTHALGSWLAWLAIIAGLLSACAFMTPFFTSGVLNAATGGLGRWAWTIGLVVWLACASVALMVEERRDQHREVPAPPAAAPAMHAKEAGS